MQYYIFPLVAADLQGLKALLMEDGVDVLELLVGGIALDADSEQGNGVCLDVTS